jgi:hypothetical protein
LHVRCAHARQVGRLSSDRFDKLIAYFHYESVIEGGGPAQIKVKALEASWNVSHHPTGTAGAVRQFQRRTVALRSTRNALRCFCFKAD